MLSAASAAEKLVASEKVLFEEVLHAGLGFAFELHADSGGDGRVMMERIREIERGCVPSRSRCGRVLASQHRGGHQHQ